MKSHLARLAFCSVIWFAAESLAAEPTKPPVKKTEGRGGPSADQPKLNLWDGTPPLSQGTEPKDQCWLWLSTKKARTASASRRTIRSCRLGQANCMVGCKRAGC